MILFSMSFFSSSCFYLQVAQCLSVRRSMTTTVFINQMTVNVATGIYSFYKRPVRNRLFFFYIMPTRLSSIECLVLTSSCHKYFPILFECDTFAL